ncbi:MAG: tRNA (guanosine(46)-N7)-methyltransferase TrmB [Crocinitomicaceae bacterium]|nr:tRNA (guanosine(46)-N7)-methyltransferase TrmB [Crocinitomicaceae bacterium]MDC0100361.1 tRNA (guanosine(46)-N7)-methyltransferase TrmB [Crocinitomicaceae bacterium]MDC1385666.1 tRNA (guanosine(46)-N7)-methyltransferase TrmB [Crocinitomicaceae bacterium]|tara:strand:+ start:4155 stop:4823 length:669 start_codon:yes stop_codon:yes gene_type:complete
MGKDKLRRFAAVKEFDNFFEPILREPFDLKGKWNKDHFKNDNPIVLELGCGKGEYSVGLGKHFPDKNFIGVDIKGARMFIGAEEALNDGMKNVAFLRTRIDFITDYFEEGEVDEIWLTFSDPQPKKPRKRLSSSLFIERYRKILKQGGIVHMKTDSDLLFEYTEEQIKEHNYDCLELTWDLYGELPENIDPVTREIFHIKTHYEDLFTRRGATIKYTKFKIH